MNFLVAALLSLTVPITSAFPSPLPPLKPVLSSNGWGPAETNRSNGEQDEDDGGRLTVGGAPFTGGVGVHAPSRLTYRVPPACSVLTTSVGVDDEVHEKGSVIFEVYGDDTLLYRSPRLTGRDAAARARVDVRGRRDLRLVVTDAGDGNDSDHADWGDVRLEGCAGGTGTRALGGPRPGVPVGTPLVIRRGGRYTGVYESRDPDVAAVTIRTSEPVILEDCQLRGPGHLISGSKVRLTVRRCHAQGLNPHVRGRAKGDFVHLAQPLDLRVENNDTQSVGGVTIRGFAGQSARGEGLRILRNRFRDIDGRRSDGQGGYLGSTGGDRGGEAAREVRNAVLFDHVQDISTAEIGWNEIVNRPWVSLVEDNINMYVSSGRAGAPILIHDNYVQGAYQLRPEAEAWFSGGGILVGDGVGSRAGENGWVRVTGNVVVSTTNYGVSVVGGVGSEVVGNRVVNSGRLPDGRVAAYANVGLVVWDYYKVGGRGAGWFGGNVVRGNVVAFSRVLGDGGVVSVPMFGHGCSVGGNRCEDNRDAGPATLAMEAEEYTRWRARLRAEGVTVGVDVR